MDILFKFEIHEGEDYFDIRELNSTNNEVKYNATVNTQAGQLILDTLRGIKAFIRKNQ